MTASDGTIHVFTFKDRGKLLSPVAHDLRLCAGPFALERDGEAVTVRCRPTAFSVDGKVVAGGGVEPLREKDHREILDNVRRKVLRADRASEIVFQGRFADGRVRGDLHLAGRVAPVDFVVTELYGRLRGRVELQPSRWGIAPFKALLGAIKLEDRVAVEFDVPA